MSKGSKDSFLKEVKQICDEMDFPYSKLSDEYFEYLPFNNALKKVDGDNKIYKFFHNLIKINLKYKYPSIIKLSKIRAVINHAGYSVFIIIFSDTLTSEVSLERYFFS